MDLHQIRKSYSRAAFDETDAPEDPYQLLRIWIDQAIAASPGDWFEPNAMSLATADAAGYVTSRIVLLKGFDHRGLVFFTNYASEKGRQLQENPRGSVVLHWPYLERQVRIDGTAERTSAEESDAYFQGRPRGHQLAAHISQQSRVVPSRHALEEAMERVKQQFGEAPIPRPEQWGGYRLCPVRFEFWQGRPNRLHDRIVYQGEGEYWRRFRLAP